MSTPSWDGNAVESAGAHGATAKQQYRDLPVIEIRKLDRIETTAPPKCGESGH